jgi:hypothetical protein
LTHFQFITEWPFGFAQILFTIALVEGSAYPGDMWSGAGDRPAGQVIKQKKEPNTTAQLQELKNGRLAMMAMAAYTSDHWIPGSVPFVPGHI